METSCILDSTSLHKVYPTVFTSFRDCPFRPEVHANLRLSVVMTVVGLFLLFAGPASAQPTRTPTPLKASDLLKVRSIDEVTLSPSGRNVAYTVRRSVPDSLGGPSTPQHVTQIRFISASGRDGSQLLTRPDKNASQPAWHPDGHHLAFVRPVDGTPQIFVLSLTGGEPYQLTDAPYGATHPQWSPRGDRLLFASLIPQSTLERDLASPPPHHRPGRTPTDLIRRVPPDTLLVLRHAKTLDAVDTLALRRDGLYRLPEDTVKTLRLPGPPARVEEEAPIPVARLRTLSPDSLNSLFRRRSLLPDTVTVAVPPDTTATPDGDLLQMRRWMTTTERSGSAEVYTRRDGLHRGAGGSAPTYRHYAVVDVPPNVGTGDPPRPAARSVTRGYRSFYDASWLPGGTQLLVSAPSQEGSGVQDRDLYVVDLDPYRLHRLLDIDGYRLTEPRVTADGTTIAFRMQERASRPYDHGEIALFALDGRSEPQIITGSFSRHVTSLRWSPDGWYLYATTGSTRGTPLYRFAPFARDDTTDGRGQTSLQETYETSRDTFSVDSTMIRAATRERVVGPSHAVQSFDITDSRAVYAAVTPDNPSELYSNTISFTAERRLTDHNAEWLRNRRIASSGPVTVRRDGISIAGRVTEPDGGTDASSPLVVLPRGGPHPFDVSNPVRTWFERQYLAGRGYACVEVWPRGSVGYGEFTHHLNFQNWGPGPGGDVLAVADTVGQRAGINAERQMLAGSGYGAYLSAWLAGQTNRFRAAVAQSGVYDLSAFLGESAASATVPLQFGGYPWEEAPRPPASVPLKPSKSALASVGLLPAVDSTVSPLTALEKNSPIRLAPKMTTPLLLLHGTDDRKTSASQSERLFTRLGVLDRPVEYVRYPGVGHDFSTSATPLQRVDRLIRLYEFLARYTPGSSSEASTVKAQR